MITAIARILSGVAALSSDEWDACAGTANPFVSHAFLTALEESHSVGGRSGWTPRRSSSTARTVALPPSPRLSESA